MQKLGSAVDVVFDGYGLGPSVKDQEHARRANKAAHIAPERHIDYDTKQLGQQEPFLANTVNKQSFIALLTDYLTTNGITVHVAEGGADVLIVSVALEHAKPLHDAQQLARPVIVLGEDTDLLALLLFHTTSDMKTIYFVSQQKKGRGGATIQGKSINIQALQLNIGYYACQTILVVHALGGCDSTSALYGIGKGKVYSTIHKGITALRESCMAIQSATASVQDVSIAGTRLLISVYGGKDSDCLSALRYQAYCKTSLSRRFNPERLPPSEGAARMHSLRVHYQVIVWGTLGKTQIKCTDWGWKLDEHGFLKPIQTDSPIAPDEVLNVIRCKCQGNCSPMLCSCKKHGLHCVSACTNCQGKDCCNSRVDVVDDDSSESDSEQPAQQVAAGATEMYDTMYDCDLFFDYEEEV